jgi:L-fuculose-phosphate aldolase
VVTESEALKEELAAACRIIGRLHLTREPNGHVSVRIPGSEHILIKARGPQESPLSYTTTDDLMVVDIDGKQISGREGLAPPSEVFIHTEVLRARPDLNSVIHLHPASVVAYTIAEKPILPIIGAYNPSALRLVQDGIPTFPRSFLINSQERGRDLVGTMGSSRLCVMRGHGITTAGASVEEATLTAIHLNDLAELHAKADYLGGAKPISDEDINDILGNLPPDVRRAGAAPRGPSSEWRYYLQAYGQL